MNEVPTKVVFVKATKEIVRINESEFDEKLHTLAPEKAAESDAKDADKSVDAKSGSKDDESTKGGAATRAKR